MSEEIEKLKAQKDNAYHERDMLLAAFSKLMISGLARHPAEEEWEDDWRNIVVIMGLREDFSFVQMTWHIHDSEMPMFEHLKPFKDFKWDGHTTEEKYARLASMKPYTGGVFPKDENNTN